MIQNYKELLVWQKGMQVVREVYAVTKELPPKENFILSAQMLRAAISIPSNIAEGFARNRKLEFIRFLEISYGSSCELETQVMIAGGEYPSVKIEKALGYNTEIQKMLRSLIAKAKDHMH